MPADMTRSVTLMFPGVAHNESTDSDAFDCRNAPGFFLTSSDWSYTDYTWHTNRDTYDKINFDDVKRNATLVAMFAYEASEDPTIVSRTRRVPPTDPRHESADGRAGVPAAGAKLGGVAAAVGRGVQGHAARVGSVLAFGRCLSRPADGRRVRRSLAARIPHGTGTHDRLADPGPRPRAAALVRRDFYVAGQGTLAPWAPPKHLVTVGLYRVSRNPMYLAVLTILIGWAVAFGSVGLGIYAVIVAIAVHLRVVSYEERWLARTFPDEWVAYRARVPRWLGRRSDS